MLANPRANPARPCTGPIDGAQTLNDKLYLLGQTYKLCIMEWEWVADNHVFQIAKEKVRNGIERWHVSLIDNWCARLESNQRPSA